MPKAMPERSLFPAFKNAHTCGRTPPSHHTPPGILVAMGIDCGAKLACAGGCDKKYRRKTLKHCVRFDGRHQWVIQVVAAVTMPDIPNFTDLTGACEEKNE